MSQICENSNISVSSDDTDITLDSDNNPYGGTVERYDIEIEKELCNIDILHTIMNLLINNNISIMSQDFFSEANEIVVTRNPYFKLENVGDSVRGILVRKSMVENQNEGKEGTFQRIYTLCVLEEDDGKWSAWKGGEKQVMKKGELIDVYGKMLIDEEETGKKVAITAGADDLQLGYLLGFKYTEQLAPTAKGRQGAKIQKAYADKSKRYMDIVEKYSPKVEELDPASIPDSF